jgi:hypothetical protein
LLQCKRIHRLLRPSAKPMMDQWVHIRGWRDCRRRPDRLPGISDKALVRSRRHPSGLRNRE